MFQGAQKKLKKRTASIFFQINSQDIQIFLQIKTLELIKYQLLSPNNHLQDNENN